MKKPILVFAMTSLAAFAARADDPAPAPTPPFTGNVELTTNYKFRGQDQGNNKPAIQGGFDFAKDGFYVGNWNSSIGFTNAGIEMDFYGGYKGEIVKDVGYDVGIYQYYYPQKNRINNASPDFNTTELYGAVSFGPSSLKYSVTVSKDYFGYGSVSGTDTYSGRGTGYLDFSTNPEISTGLTLNAHIGYTRFASGLRNNVVAPNGLVFLPNYFDFKLGVSYDLGSGFSVAGALVGANKNGEFSDATGYSINKTRVIATLSKSM